MYPPKGPEDNNYNNSNTVIIREFKTVSRIHEHDFISVKTKKD
jgi:hypothetical protein